MFYMIYTHDQWLCLECIKEIICKAECPFFEILSKTLIKVHNDQKCDKCGGSAYSRFTRDALDEIMVAVKLNLEDK